MNNLTSMLLMLSLMNKNGFNSIKNAIEAADGFNSKISTFKNMMSVLPTINNMLNTKEALNNNESDNYTDTLKDVLSFINKSH